MVKAKWGQNLDAALLRALPFLARLPVHPHVFSAAGVLLALGAAAAFAQGAFPQAAALLLLSGAFDLTDGVLARAQGRASRFGAFLDSVADRVADSAVLLGIALHYQSAGRPALAWLAGAALIASAVVSYSRARAEALGAALPGAFMERGERVAVLLLGALPALMPWALAAVAGGSAFTAAQRIIQARRKLQTPPQQGGAHAG